MVADMAANAKGEAAADVLADMAACANGELTDLVAHAGKRQRVQRGKQQLMQKRIWQRVQKRE